MCDINMTTFDKRELCLIRGVEFFKEDYSPMGWLDKPLESLKNLRAFDRPGIPVYLQKRHETVMLQMFDYAVGCCYSVLLQSFLLAVDIQHRNDYTHTSRFELDLLWYKSIRASVNHKMLLDLLSLKTVVSSTTT